MFVKIVKVLEPLYCYTGSGSDYVTKWMSSTVLNILRVSDRESHVGFFGVGQGLHGSLLRRVELYEFILFFTGTKFTVAVKYRIRNKSDEE